MLGMLHKRKMPYLYIVMRKKHFFHENSLMADVIDTNPSLLSFLERNHIGLGFGDSTVQEVCDRHGMSSSLILAICNIYTFPDFIPDAGALSGEDLEHILYFLKESHRNYEENLLPALHECIHKMAEQCTSANKAIVNKFFDQYDAETRRHFQHEEQVVFPYVEALAAGRTKGDFRIADFAETHEGDTEKLEDFRNILLKYLPEACGGPERYQVLSALYLISEDLRCHAIVENRLMVPLAMQMEETV